jgi:uncharacterized protein
MNVWSMTISATASTPTSPRLEPEWRERVRAFAAEHLQHTAWGVAHAERNYALTRALADEEHITVDTDAVYAAAFLHDMGAFPQFALDGVDHGVRSADLVGTVLHDLGFPVAKLSLVEEIVRHHMYYHQPGRSAESRLFRDADTLDLLGAIGVARLLSITTRHRWAPDLGGAVATITTNLALLPDTLHYASARRIGRVRSAETAGFLTALADDRGPSGAL